MGDQEVALSSHRALEHFSICAMVGCYLTRARNSFFCCEGHQLLAQEFSLESELPFHFYGGFISTDERNSYCVSLLILKKEEKVDVGIPNMDAIGDLFSSLPWNHPRFRVPVPEPARVSFLFYKKRPTSYPPIFNFNKDEFQQKDRMGWKANGSRRRVINGKNVLVQSVSLRSEGLLAEKLKNQQPGKWTLVNFVYKTETLFCMSYERDTCYEEVEFDNDDDDKEEPDEKHPGDKEEPDEKHPGSKEEPDDKHPGSSLTKARRNQSTRPRDMSVPFRGLGLNSTTPLLKGTGGSATQGEISLSSWNRTVQPILASTSYNGTNVIWNLTKQKPRINFADSVRRRCPVLQSNPDIATQIMVASDDDCSPTLKLWNMRNIIQLVREFTGHQKGAIAMEWYPRDSSYLLTCAEDNRTICWDTNTAEIVAELLAGNNWNFDFHSYPKIPGVISAPSFDGKIGIYNIEVVSAVMNNEFTSLFSTRSHKFWKETLAFLCTQSYPRAPVSNAQASMTTTFVPSTPSALRNADQYQQPTVGSHSFTMDAKKSLTWDEPEEMSSPKLTWEEHLDSTKKSSGGVMFPKSAVKSERYLTCEVLISDISAYEGQSNNAYAVPSGLGPYASSGPSQVGEYSNTNMMPEVVAPGGGGPIGFTPMATPVVQPASPPTQQASATDCSVSRYFRRASFNEELEMKMCLK